MTTIEEFRASQRFYVNLGEIVRDEQLEGCPGFAYFVGKPPGCTMYIKRMPDGTWWTMLDREEYRSVNLTTIERKVYDWGVEERMIEQLTPHQETIEYMIGGITRAVDEGPIRVVCRELLDWLKTRRDEEAIEREGQA